MRVAIKKKMVTYARRAIRERVGDRSIYVRRLYGKYYINVCTVTQKQERQRSYFAQAQAISQAELSDRMRRRYWERRAKASKIKGAHRMVVSVLCKMLKRYEGDVDEVLVRLSEKRRSLGERRNRTVETNIIGLVDSKKEEVGRNTNMKLRQKNTTLLYHYNEKSINLQRGICRT